TAAATDADVTPAFKTIAYSLTGDDAALFSIDPTSGAVRFLASPDYEASADQDHDNVYKITVHANDGLHDVTQDVAITVADQNDNVPTIISVPVGSVAENTSTSFYVAVAQDADGTAANNTIAYSLSGDDAALFAIDTGTGALRFVTAPDYEAPTDQDHDN